MRCAFCKNACERRSFSCGRCNARRGYRFRNRIVPKREIRRKRLYPALIGLLAGAIGTMLLPAQLLIWGIVIISATLALWDYYKLTARGPQWWRRSIAS